MREDSNYLTPKCGNRDFNSFKNALSVKNELIADSSGGLMSPSLKVHFFSNLPLE